MKYAMKSETRKTSDVRGWMVLDNVTSHFSTMLEPIASASFLSSLSIIHAVKELGHDRLCISAVLNPQNLSRWNMFWGLTAEYPATLKQPLKIGGYADT